MLGAFRKNKFFAWAMMGILVAAMAGFGLGGVLSGGAVNSVARVGDERISVDEFVNGFQNRRTDLNRQVGRAVSTLEARAFGLDQAVLGELIRGATLSAEASNQGVGVSDRMVQAELLRQPGFQDLSGAFDRDTYEFALQNAGITPAEYDETLRTQAQQQLVATALGEGARLPDAAIDALLAYTGERRAVALANLPRSLFEGDVTEPSTVELQAHLDAFPDRFETPETREATYAVLDVAVIAEMMDVSDADVQAAFDADPERFSTPERRAVDRIPFPDTAAAEVALIALSDGSLTTGAIAEERGLSPQDFSLGLVEAIDLTLAEREAVFGADNVGVVGPVSTDFGPALFVVNAIIAAEDVPQEEAFDILRTELQLEAAEDVAFAEIVEAEELIAGGATVEEIAETMSFQQFTADVTATGGTGEHVADFQFRRAVNNAEIGIETDPIEGGDGRVYVIRVDNVRAPAVPPLAEIEDEVAADWRADQASQAARAAVDALLLSADGALVVASERFGVEITEPNAVTRDGRIPGLTQNQVTEIFGAAEGDILVFDSAEGLTLVELRSIEAFDTEGAETLRSIVAAQQSQGLSNDIVAYFAQGRSQELGTSVDTIAVDQILTQLP